MTADAASDLVDFVTDAPTASGTLEVTWRHGVRRRRGSEPPIQVHRFDEHTFVLRQSKTVSYEAPFLYLFLGNERALLLDTGAVADAARCPVRETVDRLIATWLEAHPRAAYSLVVAHTHGHGDHVAGDAQFADRPDTSIVASDRDAVTNFFGFTSWPEQVVQLDLGGRVLELSGIPGHHAASIVVFDPWSGFLVTGDTVYPGRLYVEDMPAFVDSLERLVGFAASRPVRHVMGCHIEMSTTSGRDYPLGSTYQPNEPPLQMTVDQLQSVRDAAVSVADSPGAHAFDDFLIFNGPCRTVMARQMVRALWAKVLPPGAG